VARAFGLAHLGIEFWMCVLNTIGLWGVVVNDDRGDGWSMGHILARLRPH